MHMQHTRSHIHTYKHILMYIQTHTSMLYVHFLINGTVHTYVLYIHTYVCTNKYVYLNHSLEFLFWGRNSFCELFFQLFNSSLISFQVILSLLKLTADRKGRKDFMKAQYQPSASQQIQRNGALKVMSWQNLTITVLMFRHKFGCHNHTSPIKKL